VDENINMDENIDAGVSIDTGKNRNVDEYSSMDEYSDMDEYGDESNGGKRRSRSTRSSDRRRIIYISLMIVGVVLATVALRVILNDASEDAAARSEYGQIRERFPEVSGPANDEPVSENIEDFDEDLDIVADEEEARALRELSLDELAGINNDFIGWINALYSIDYPVVRGRDNDRYVNTTFFGNQNSAGTIFMDYRNASGFDEHVVILYGHRTRDGSMFTSLESYLTPDVMRRNPNITITTRDGRRVTYTVFAAKVTDAWDPAYTVGIYEAERASEVFPDAPQNANHFLLLSTCTRGSNNDERLLVFAALT
jgi:sortase B